MLFRQRNTIYCKAQSAFHHTQLNELFKFMTLHDTKEEGSNIEINFVLKKYNCTSAFLKFFSISVVASDRPSK